MVGYTNTYKLELGLPNDVHSRICTSTTDDVSNRPIDH